MFDPINPPTGFVEATGVATLFIQSVVIDTPGANYTSAPTVTINDPTGAGAAAIAALDNGVISAITLTKPGSGYITPGGMKKFVDTLPGLTDGWGEQPRPVHPGRRSPTTTDVPQKPTTTSSRVVQHREQMSSSLPAGTLLREYVQLVDEPSSLASTSRSCRTISRVLRRPS